MLDPDHGSPAGAPNHSLARLLDALPDVVIVLDDSGNVLWGNSRAEHLFGVTLEEFHGHSALDFVHPDDLELVLRSLSSIQSKDVGTTLEVRAKGTTGWRLLELIGAPVPWFAPGAVLFSLRDLTDRRRFEVAHDEVARFRSLVHHATAITMLVTADGYIESASGALTRMLGWDPERVEGMPLVDIAAEPDRPALRVALEHAANGANSAHPVVIMAHILRHDAGGALPFELSFVNLVDEPTVGGFIVTAHDISSQVAVELELRTALSLLKATLDSTADGVVVVDRDGNVTGVNGRLSEMWHVPDDKIALQLDRPADERSLSFVFDQLVDPDAFTSLYEQISANPEHETTDILEFKDGRVFERFSRAQLVDGEIVGRVWSFRDSTERVRLESELSYQAFHDSLTGLANKALFTDRLNLAVARMERTRKPMAVMFLDLDNFKTVNDSLGHSTGDELLRVVAEVLLGCIRSTDTAARLGGDEFAVLIDYLEGHSDIVALAERILTALRRPVALGKNEVVATASIGITFGVPGTTGEQLLRNADLAMYRAKEHGKDRFEEFRDQMHTAIVERLELEADLRRTMGGNQELVVHYQPVIDLINGGIIGFEALVRWQHPLRGLLQPLAFVPFAEEVGLIDVVDRFVLAEACAQLHYWQQRGLVASDTVMSVNLSARELTDPGTATYVAEILADAAFDPSNLILEVTESAMMRDTETVVENLRSLRALGLRIAVDDFGTGYSSLAYLEQFPVDILKIDRSFVTALSDDDPGGLAQTIIQIGQNLGLMTVAEGVESEEQAERLRALGCRAAQGYHLGMPLNAYATEELLRAQGPLIRSSPPR
jgi:diguanylate cyclase (GGDEF)-like protein/PAS domain S-box-containing protein